MSEIAELQKNVKSVSVLDSQGAEIVQVLWQVFCLIPCTGEATSELKWLQISLWQSCM